TQAIRVRPAPERPLPAPRCPRTQRLPLAGSCNLVYRILVKVVTEAEHGDNNSGSVTTSLISAVRAMIMRQKKIERSNNESREADCRDLGPARNSGIRARSKTVEACGDRTEGRCRFHAHGWRT